MRKKRLSRNFSKQRSYEIFTKLKNNLKLEGWQFLDLSWYRHTSVTETQKNLSFSVINFFSQKPDLLFPRIPDFIQKNFLPWGEHHDWQNPNWKPFKLLERYCEYLGYDYYESLDIIQERVYSTQKTFLMVFLLNRQLNRYNVSRENAGFALS